MGVRSSPSNSPVYSRIKDLAESQTPIRESHAFIQISDASLVPALQQLGGEICYYLISLFASDFLPFASFIVEQGSAATLAAHRKPKSSLL